MRVMQLDFAELADPHPEYPHFPQINVFSKEGAIIFVLTPTISASAIVSAPAMARRISASTIVRSINAGIKAIEAGGTLAEDPSYVPEFKSVRASKKGG